MTDIKEINLSEWAKILDALPFYVLLIDSKHNIVFANNKVKSDLGVDSNKIIGSYCPKVIHGSTKPIERCPLEEAVKINAAVEREFFDPGTYKWFSSAVYPSEAQTHKGEKIYFHMIKDITELRTAQKELEVTLRKVKEIAVSTIGAITTAVEKRDPYTAGHQQRVSRIACDIARRMDLDENIIEGIEMSGLVHDVGKIAVPIEILSKPGRINEYEYNLIKLHSYTGYEILKKIDFPWPVAETVYQHHEREDGSGYPRGITGKEILLEAKILNVADVVEAMASHRPYRQSLGIEKALEEISQKKGILYDSNVVEACLSIFKDKEYKIRD